MAGSSTCLNTVVSEPTTDLAITHYPSAVGPEGYVTEVGINTAGEAIDWLASLTYGGRSGRVRTADFEVLDREAGEVAPGSDGLLFVPVLGDGERDDPALRGQPSASRPDMTESPWREPRSKALPLRFALTSRNWGKQARRPPRCASPAARPPCGRGITSRRTSSAFPLLVFRATRPPLAWRCSRGSVCASTRMPSSAIAAACRPEPQIQPDPANHDRYEAVYARYRSVVASAALHAGASSTERPAGGRA